MPGRVSARFLAVGVGSAALMALPAWAGATPAEAAPVATSAPAAGSQAVSLTADVQPLPSSSIGDLFNQATTGVQNFVGQVGTAINNSMAAYGQAEILSAQANDAMARGVIAALPYAVQEMKGGAETGFAAGTLVGGAVGGAVGAVAGSVTLPGAGTGAGFFGGAYVGGEFGLVLGTAGGGAAGFLHGLFTAPTWQTLTVNPAFQNTSQQDTVTDPSGSTALQQLTGTATQGPSAQASVVQQFYSEFGITQDGQVLGRAPASADSLVQGIQPAAAQPPAEQPPAEQPPPVQPSPVQPPSGQQPDGPAQPAPSAPVQSAPGSQGQADTGTAVAQTDNPAPAADSGSGQVPAADQTMGPDQTIGPDQITGADQLGSSSAMVAMADVTGPAAVDG